MSTASAASGAEAGHPRIAIDLLGGDEAPAVVVDGVLRACEADAEVRFLLVGPVEAANEVVGALARSQRDRVTVIPARDVAGMTDSPIMSVRRPTTVRVAMDALGTDRADALVSAGPSNAIVAIGAHRLGRLSGLRRPVLAAVIPAALGRVVLADVGACVDVLPSELLWNAVLSSVYAACAEGMGSPRVGLLSIGVEPGKGDRLRVETSHRLADLALPCGGSYVGLVEGHDVARGGVADVVVTDGFTGNVLLKGIEGAYELAASDEPTSGGVPRAAALLGLRGTVVVCHGAAAACDIAAGIALAARLCRLRLSARLAAETRELPMEVR